MFFVALQGAVLKKQFYILFLGLSLASLTSFSQNLQKVHFDFYGDMIDLPFDQTTFVDFTDTLSNENIKRFYDKVNDSHFEQVVNSLLL